MIKIGSRGSKLALWQANFLSAKLEEIGFQTDIQIIKTKGDQIQDLSFDKIEGKGFFTKEIEDALINEEVDLAVHSMKDMPTAQVPGLCITAVSYRETPNDCLLILPDSTVEQNILKLKKNAVVGTSSARRKCMIKHLVADCSTKDIRGNVPTRVQKLRDGQFDAIILAKAGLNRLDLDLSDLIVVDLNPREFVPAPAQGVLAYQCRLENKQMRKIMTRIHHTEVSRVTNVERRILQLFDGGCHLPLGAYCYQDKNHFFHCFAMYAPSEDVAPKYAYLSQSTSHQLAERIFEQLSSK